MSQYASMAEQVRRDMKDNDIDGAISKYASSHNLNDNQKQRLVEEVNVGTFLSKLSEGTQYEDFPVASPTITHSDGESPVLSSTELNKAASQHFDVTSDMFSIGKKDDYCDPDILQKAASSSLNSEIMNSEDKWEAAEEERKKAIEESSKRLTKVAHIDEVYELLSVITKSSNESEGMVKTASAVLVINDLEELAMTLLENSKHSSSDVSESIAEPLSKEASYAMERLLEKEAKNLLKDTGDVFKGLKNVVKYPVKHPIVAAGTVGGVMYAKSDRADLPDSERMKMSLRNYGNG